MSFHTNDPANYAHRTTSFLDPTQDFTICAWINTSVAPPSQYIALYESGKSDYSKYFGIYFNASSQVLKHSHFLLIVYS